METTGDVRALPTRKTRFRWAVMGLIFAVYTLAAADRANIGIVLPSIKTEFGLSNTEAGAIVSMFFIGYALAQIPAGFLVQRFGTRSIFPVFMLATSLFTALLGTASSAIALKLNRLALGIAEGPLPVTMLSTINRWFPPSEKGTANGLFLAAAKFGPVIVPPLGALIIANFGWRYVFYMCALPGLLFPVLWLVMVPDDPATSRHVSPQELMDIRTDATKTRPLPLDKTGRPRRAVPEWLDVLIRARSVRPIATVRDVFRSKDIWGVAVGYMLITGTVNVILAWLPSYLTVVKKFSLMNTGFVATAPFVGGVVGNILGGWFSDRIVAKRRKPTILITAVSGMFTMYGLIHAPNDPLLLSAFLFIAGLLLNMGYSSFLVYSAGLTTGEVYPVAVSTVNAAGQAAAALFPFVTGLLLDAYDWDAVFLFLGSSCLATVVVTLLVVEPIDAEGTAEMPLGKT